MSDYSKYDFTGKVTKIITHTGESLVFIVTQSTERGDVTFSCHTFGKVAAFLSGNIQPGHKIWGTGRLVWIDGNVSVFVNLIYKTSQEWGGSGMKIKPRQKPPTSKNILHKS